MGSISGTYLQYSVSNELAMKLERIGIPLSTFRSTSNNILTDRFNLSAEEVDLVKNKIQRQPINQETLIELLENNNYTCCICKGIKSDGYIVHHIEEYSISQNNEYSNLAVVCPNDHDLAHRSGQHLSNKLTPEQIRKAKSNWEKQVHVNNVYRSCHRGEVHELDFCNITRIYDLCYQTFNEIPKIEITEKLIEENLILPSGQVNDAHLNEIYPERIHTPLKFWALGGGAQLRYYFYHLFLKVIERVKVENLEDLMKKKVIKSRNLEGVMCLYIGGLYGKRPITPITDETEPTSLYLRRKPFFIDWLVNPQFLTSSTSISRMSHSIYFIYGKIRKVGIKEWKGERFIHFDIRPYIFGIPSNQVDRTPNIHYIKNGNIYDDLFGEEE